MVLNENQIKYIKQNIFDRQEELFEYVVPEFEEKLIDKFKQYDLYIAMSYSFSKRALEISHIILPEIHRNKGIGTKVMKELCEFADHNKINMFLLPEEIDGVPTDVLIKFYKKFGFKLTNSGYMFRYN